MYEILTLFSSRSNGLDSSIRAFFMLLMATLLFCKDIKLLLLQLVTGEIRCIFYCKNL